MESATYGQFGSFPAFSDKMEVDSYEKQILDWPYGHLYLYLYLYSSLSSLFTRCQRKDNDTL
jgi:hypothetical protein